METVNTAKRKILFLVTQSEMGGAQRYIYEVSKILSERHEILVAAGEGDGEFFQKLKNTPVEPVYLKHLQRTPEPHSIIMAIVEIIKLLKAERPDVLFLCSTTAGLLGSIAARIYRGPTSRQICREVGPRVIYRIGGWAFNDPRPFWKNWLILLAEKLTARFKDIIVVNSEYDLRIALEKRIVSPEKIVKIYNGLDRNSLNFLPKDEARGLLTSDVNRRMIGCVANFYKTKGLKCLIDAFDFLMSGFPKKSDIKLFVIGDGKLRSELEAQIKKLDLEDRVILAGRMPDAYKYLKAFDVFVLPSLKEGFPWVILEAAVADVPIVATKVGAIPEILPEEFLVKPGDAQALAKKIGWMLEHPAVPKLKQNFSLQKMAEETERLL
ncbi:MAG: glycosyltransferase [Candidatus Nealsonbacteria bacterium]|nr:glycosyltransferase [Candidatus Nealsonbacteria bacterium]